MSTMRLDKLLSHSGFGSRKEVKKFIREGHIKVNGDVVLDDDMRIDLDTDEVIAGDNYINFKPTVYYLLNKPENYICSTDDLDYPSALSLVDDLRPDLIMAGRLDVDTEGMLVITNDGQFAHQLMHGKKEIPKTYYVVLRDDFNQDYISDLETGIDLEDFTTSPAEVEVIDDKEILLTIYEGKYHQVKRMMHYCDNEVEYLRRVKLGDLELDEDLEIGDYRELTEQECDLLLQK